MNRVQKDAWLARLARPFSMGHRSVRRRRGASAVEMAVVAPLFFMMIFGMIEFGRMLMVQQMITNAAREGAREAIIEGSTTASIEAVVESYVAAGGISAEDMTITITPSNVTALERGDTVAVSIAVPYNDVSWLPAPWFLDNVTLTSTATMRHE